AGGTWKSGPIAQPEMSAAVTMAEKRHRATRHGRARPTVARNGSNAAGTRHRPSTMTNSTPGDTPTLDHEPPLPAQIPAAPQTFENRSSATRRQGPMEVRCGHVACGILPARAG